MDDKKRAKQEALWGPGGGLVVYTKRGGRESNRKYRKDQVEKKIRSMLSGSPKPEYQEGTVADVPMARVSSGFASLPLEAQRLKAKGISPDVGFRTVMNSPMTAAGLIRSALHGKMPRADTEGNILSDAPPAQGAWGQTMGEVMFINPELDPDTKRETVAHEKEHVRQGGKMSLLYPILNALESGQLFARGKDPYEENRFEKAAERAREEEKKPEYRRGTLPPGSSRTSSSPAAWESSVRSGPMARMFNPDAAVPTKLRGMTSSGSLGHMFVGGGDAAQTLTGGGGMAPAPSRRPVAPPAAPAAPVSRGPDWGGLRTPGMGETRPYEPAAQPTPYRKLPPLPMGAPYTGGPRYTPEQVNEAVKRSGLRERFGKAYGYEGPMQPTPPGGWPSPGGDSSFNAGPRGWTPSNEIPGYITSPVRDASWGRSRPSYQEGTLSRITDTLADLPYELRYGMGAEEKDVATALGKAPGFEEPGAAGQDWPAARRAMSSYLASQKWGKSAPRAAQQIRNALKFWADPGFRYSQPGQEASGWDTRMDEIVERASEEASRGRGGGGQGW